MFSLHVRSFIALVLAAYSQYVFSGCGSGCGPAYESVNCNLEFVTYSSESGFNGPNPKLYCYYDCGNSVGNVAAIIGCTHCEEGEILDTETGQCEEPVDCPDGTKPISDGLGNTICFPDGSTDDDEDECEDVAGYVNGAEVCNDDKNECEEQGGVYGCAGSGSTMNCGCFPADDVPECDSNEVITITESGYVCTPPNPDAPPDPDDPDNDDIPNSEDDDDDNDGIPDEADDDANGDGVPDQDTDGDGVPNYVDSDIDGDGIPNNLDPDADGDGVNEDKNGTGPCDPTQKNYWECIGADKGESGGDNGEALDELGTKLDTLDGTLKDELGDANDSLDDLKQALDFSAKEMPGHISAPGSFGEVHSSFYAAISNAPIITAFNSVSGIVPDTGGDCPPLDYDLTGTIIGTTVSTDIHCQLLEDSSSYIYSIMLVVYSVFGFRILTRA